MNGNPRCPRCNGAGLMRGVLGYLRWFACRDCGWEFSRKIRKCTKKRRA
jgi:hypothetical protein